MLYIIYFFYNSFRRFVTSGAFFKNFKIINTAFIARMSMSTRIKYTFFSVIIPIHEAFLNEKNINNISGSAVDKTAPKRRTKKQIKALILEVLSNESVSTNELYKRLGYSGNASKTFRDCIDELIAEERIHYASESLKDSNNVLIKN